jgi:hypothetical protein
VVTEPGRMLNPGAPLSPPGSLGEGSFSHPIRSTTLTSCSVSPDDDPREEPPEHHPSLLERLRGSGVGTEDPNIIGDAGPTDVAPGGDPDLAPLTEPLPDEEETPSERRLPSDATLPAAVVEPVAGDPDDVEAIEVVEIVVFPADEGA